MEAKMLGVAKLQRDLFKAEAMILQGQLLKAIEALNEAEVVAREDGRSEILCQIVVMKSGVLIQQGKTLQALDSIAVFKKSDDYMQVSVESRLRMIEFVRVWHGENYVESVQMA